MSLLHASILTIFPEMFPGPLQYSLAGQALKKGLWSYNTINIRDFGLTKQKNVDDEAYGGGSGLIMRPDVLGNAIDHALSLNPGSKIIYPSPRGKLFTQNIAHEIIRKTASSRTNVHEDLGTDRADKSPAEVDFCRQSHLIILCGRFEGIDERVIQEYNIAEISIGDYILSGGEIAAFTILDCLIRLLPGVLTNQDTLQSESFETDGEFAGLLECALYTRPVEWRGRKAPDILLSGNHHMIKNWKREQSIAITKLRRPELLDL